MDILDEKFATTAFIAGLGVQSKDLMFSISKNPQASMAEVLSKTEKYINDEEALHSKKRSSSTPKEKSRGYKKRERNPKRPADRERSPRRSRESRERSPTRRGKVRDRRGPPRLELQQRYSPQQYTPLTASVSQVLREVQHKRFLRWSSQMKSDPTRIDNTKYYEFHKDHEHRTDDCIQLKKEIEYLIRRGHLSRYVASEGRERDHPPPPLQTTPVQHYPHLGEIHVISGGFVGGGESNSTRNAHLHNIRLGETLEVQTISKLPQLDTTVTFPDFDMEDCQHPHDDPLMIKVIVANKTIHRVLVDNRSSAYIIFASAFDKMGIGRKKLEPVNTCLCGFSGERVLPLGSVQLVLTLGDPPCQATTTVRFLIVDAPSAYNMFLGRPFLNAIRVVPSAYHMVIKFPTAKSVRMVRGNQRIARECYSASMKRNMVDNIYTDELDMRDEVTTRPAASEELEPVQLGDQSEHLVYIGSKLAEGIRSSLIHFLKQNMEVFAWK